MLQIENAVQVHISNCQNNKSQKWLLAQKIVYSINIKYTLVQQGFPSYYPKSEKIEVTSLLKFTLK
jgi:hypothetical protein